MCVCTNLISLTINDRFIFFYYHSINSVCTLILLWQIISLYYEQ